MDITNLLRHMLLEYEGITINGNDFSTENYIFCIGAVLNDSIQTALDEGFTIDETGKQSPFTIDSLRERIYKIHNIPYLSTYKLFVIPKEHGRIINGLYDINILNQNYEIDLDDIYLLTERAQRILNFYSVRSIELFFSGKLKVKYYSDKYGESEFCGNSYDGFTLPSTPIPEITQQYEVTSFNLSRYDDESIIVESADFVDLQEEWDENYNTDFVTKDTTLNDFKSETLDLLSKEKNPRYTKLIHDLSIC